MTKNLYTELRDKQFAELDVIPKFFAFDKRQFDEGMERLGLQPSELNKLVCVNNLYHILKSDCDKMEEIANRHEVERKQAMKSPAYLFDMFLYELRNHEYGYTFELGDTLDSLELTFEEIQKNSLLKTALDKAIRIIKKEEGCF